MRNAVHLEYRVGLAQLPVESVPEVTSHVSAIKANLHPSKRTEAALTRRVGQIDRASIDGLREGVADLPVEAEPGWARRRAVDREVVPVQADFCPLRIDVRSCWISVQTLLASSGPSWQPVGSTAMRSAISSACESGARILASESR